MSTDISPPAPSHASSARQASSKSGKAQPSIEGPGAEVLNSILWRLKARNESGDPLLVGICGTENRAGTSTIAHGLATLLGQQSAGRVLLIDASGKSKRKSAQSSGLESILSGAMAPLECPLTPLSENVDLLPSGTLHDSNCMVEDRLVSDMLEQFSDHYDAIVVDLPAGNELKSALPLAKQLPGVLLVVRSEASKQTQAQEVAQLLAEDGVEILGTVLNGYRDFVPKWLRKWL